MSIETDRLNRSGFLIWSRAVFSSEKIRSKSKDAIRGFFIWLASLLATAIIVAISFQWLDRPIALLVHSGPHEPNNGLWIWLTPIPNPLIPLALIAFVVLGLRALLGRSLLNRQAVAFVCSLSVIVTETAKDQLKF